MHTALIIDQYFEHALKFAAQFDDPDLQCKVIAIEQLDYLGARHFLSRKPDFLFIFLSSMSMDIYEFLSICQQATHQYTILLVAANDSESCLLHLPENCVQLNEKQLNKTVLVSLLSSHSSDDSHVYVKDYSILENSELFHTLLNESSERRMALLAQELGMPQPYQSLYFILVHLRSPWSDNEFSIFDHALREQKIGCLIVIPNSSYNLLVCLSGVKHISASTISYMAMRAKLSVNSLVWGSPFQLFNIALAYSRICSYQDRLYLFKEDTVLDETDIHLPHPIKHDDLMRWGEQLAASVFSLDEDGAQQILGSFYYVMLSSFQSLENLDAGRAIITEIYSLLHKGSAYDISLDPFWGDWSRFSTIEQEYDYVYSAFLKFIAVYNEGLSDSSLLISKAVRWINNNINDNISLRDVAEALAVTKEHLSSTFHKECGIAMTRYINNLKVCFARFLIRIGADYKSVPQRLGFTDTKYFNRLYKNYFNESMRETVSLDF